jgi:hypothetical protein
MNLGTPEGAISNFFGRTIYIVKEGTEKNERKRKKQGLIYSYHVHFRIAYHCPWSRVIQNRSLYPRALWDQFDRFSNLIFLFSSHPLASQVQKMLEQYRMALVDEAELRYISTLHMMTVITYLVHKKGA